MGVGDRLQRDVARRGAGRDRPQRLTHSCGSPSTPGAGTSSTTRSDGLGERAGLVDADRVHGSQRLDRVELLGQHAAARHAHGRGGVGQADEHHQALRDQAHDSGRRGRHRGVEGARGGDTASSRAAAPSPMTRPRAGVEQTVDRPLQRRARVAEGARLAGEPRGEAVGADGGHLVCARALGDERSRAHLIADLAPHGLRLAGEDRLVEPQVGDGEQASVGDRPGRRARAATRSPTTTSATGSSRCSPVAPDPRVRRDEQRRADRARAWPAPPG